MRATNWEFANRALIFGLIFGVSFPLYFIDHENSTATLANWLAPRLGLDADLVARALFLCAALLLAFSAFIRTWASSYLHARVVYAAAVQTESLIGDGPYRHVRNPLYFANVPIAIGLGSMMSRTGFLVAVITMVVFTYRLILREENELHAAQGESYDRYRKAVPRLWPALLPRIPSSDRHPRWADGVKAEFWCWGITASVAAFAITLNMRVFFIMLTASIALFWLSSSILQKKS